MTKSYLSPLSLFFIFIAFFSVQALLALNETEPNNSLATANSTFQDSTMFGVIGGVGDANDYFVATSVEDGNITLTTLYTASLASNDFFIYVYNKNGALLSNSINYDVGVGTNTDFIQLNCRQQDTLFVRISSSGSINYSFSFTTDANPIPNDTEPNNVLADANFFSITDTVKGRIGYASLTADNDDYFYSVLPDDGTLKYFVKYNNTSESTSSNFFSYIYGSNGATLANSFNYNQPLGISYDTIVLHCRQADTVYFRMSASGCFGYEFHLETTSSGTDDAEPNNVLADANFFPITDTVIGRIGYTSLSTDNNDYFYSVLPDNGTLKYFVKYNNTSESTSSNFFSYIYGSNGATLANSFKYNQPVGISYDTIVLHCRQADTVYFRMSASGCFGYEFHLETTSSGTDDAEPNNVLADANFFSITDTVKGRIGYASLTADNDDYFYSVLPDDGTLKYFVKYNNTSESTSSNFFSYIYGSNGATLANSFNYNQPLGISYDTIVLHCRQADTVYFRMSASGCFGYEFHLETTSSGTDDAEPNNVLADANFFPITDTVIGRIGYTSLSTDNNDYFYSVLPDNGTLKYFVKYNNTSESTSSNFFSYIYGSNGATLANSFKYNQPVGISYDTIVLHCRQADTVYFRMSASGCFGYEFHLETTSSGTDDAEPNNTSTTATPINLGDTLRGRIGYRSITTDNNDYYSFTTSGIVSINTLIQNNNTSNSASNIFYYLYNSNGGLVWNEYLYSNPIGVNQDTSMMACLPPDTYTLRVNSNSCYSYELVFDVEDQQPVANISYSRFGNQFAFMSKIGVSDSVFWDFDDGTTSSLFFPIKEFVIGEYDVTLSSINEQCNITATDTTQIVVEGIEYYTPKKAGMFENIGFFSLRIFGGGLDSNSVVTLTNGSVVLQPFQIGSPSGTEFTALFRFNDAVVGMYDVNIQLSSGLSYDYPNGFEIYEDEPGFDISTNISGPSVVRTNRWTNFSLNVYNDRDRIANGVMAIIALPRGVETNLLDIHEKKTGEYIITGSEWDKLTIDRDDFNTIYYNGSFNPMTDSIVINYDSVYAQLDSVIGINIDTLFDKAYYGTVYPIYIPMIAGQGTYHLEFKIRSTFNSNNLNATSYAWPYNFRQNPVSGQTLDYIHEGGMQMAALAELAPNPALRFVGQNAGRVDIGSQVVFTEFFDWYYGVNNADAEFYAKQAKAAAFEVGGGKVVSGKYADKYKKSAQNYKRRIGQETEHLKQLQDIARNGRMSPTMAKRTSDRIQQYKDKIKQLGEFATDAEKYGAMEELQDYLKKRGINLSEKAIDELLFSEGTELNKPNDINRKNVRSITSRDPNAIYGKSGPTNLNYIREDDHLEYMVTFENVDTALAPAQIVRIELTLDTSVFDLKQTFLSNITIAENTYFFEQDRNQYFTEIDLRPNKEIIVRVNANIDTLTGEVLWQFTSLEPDTKELLIDALDGFLPPNVTIPEGEGSVSFETRLRNSVQNEDSVGAVANIYFDENDPIVTNIWTNYIDEQAPSSSMSPTVTVSNDTVMTITYSGSDMESGLENYYLKARVNSDEWIGADFPLSESGTAEVYGTPGNTYSFYVISQDSVGNREQKSPSPEAEVTLNTTESDFNPSFTVYPNPNQGDLFVKANGNFADVEVVIYSITGQVAYVAERSFTAGIQESFALPELRQGAYLVHFTNKAGKRNVQKLLIIRPD